VSWKNAKPLDPGLLRIFGWGNRIQSIVMAAIHEAEVDVIGYEQPVHWPDLELTGRYDLLLRVPGQRVHRDIKSMSPNIFPGLNTLDDLRNSDHVYHRCYVTQATLYAIHDDVQAADTGLLCFNKGTSETKEIAWDPAECEEEVNRAFEACEKINEAIRIGDPTGLETPGPYCLDCDFSHICGHFTAEAAGYEMAPEEVALSVETMQALKEQIKPTENEIKKLDKQVKSHWKTQEPGTHICGEWLAKVTRIAEKVIPPQPEKTKAGYDRVTYKRIGESQ
jgi:hypothetical protein